MLRTPANRPVSSAAVASEQPFTATDALAGGMMDGSLLVGGMPPQPPTLRGKTGRILVSLVRRSVFWLSDQIRTFQTAVAASQKELAHALRMQSAEIARLRQLVESGEQTRQTIAAGEARIVAACETQIGQLATELRGLGAVVENLSSRFENWDRQQEQALQAMAETLRAQNVEFETQIAAIGGRADDLRARQDDLRAKQEDVTGHLMRRIHDVLLRVESLEKVRVTPEHLASTNDALGRTNKTIDELKRIAGEQNAQIIQLKDTLRQADRYFHQTRMQLALQERRLTTLFRESRGGAGTPSGSDQVAPLTDPIYVEFEDLFRGDREDIKQRFTYYIPRLKDAGLGTPETAVLDVGCGRGEWLELLRDNGMTGSGVDMNTVMVEQCVSRGLSATIADAISYLRSLPDGSKGVVTGFHIVEHLPLDVLLTLLDETVRVLRRGGMAIFETPNPSNMLVSTENFYMDPTHRNPLPKALMKFLAEARGLCDVEILPLHPYPASYRLPDDGQPATRLLNQLLYSEQDYAVVGRKA